MPRRGHTEEQILQALRQAEGGGKAAEICRKLGISEQAAYTTTLARRDAGMANRRAALTPIPLRS